MNISLKNANTPQRLGRINCSHVMTFLYKMFAQITTGSFFVWEIRNLGNHLCRAPFLIPVLTGSFSLSR